MSDVADVTSSVDELKIKDNEEVNDGEKVMLATPGDEDDSDSEEETVDAAPTRRKPRNLQETSTDGSQDKAESPSEETDAIFSREAKPSEPVKAETAVESAAHDAEYVYKTYPKRGRALIINNKNFDPKTGMNVRNGTDLDRDNLNRTFNRLGFEVKAYDNLSVGKMHAVLKLLARENHSDSDCVAVAILSHGDDGIIYGIDGTTPVEELTKYFRGDRCEALVGKPKLFFLQACRGNEFDDGVLLKAADQTDAAPVAQRLPVEADFLICYSTVPGYYSWRNPKNGSWFVQAICQVFDRHGQSMDVLRMMTRVSKMVAYSFESSTYNIKMHQKKQIPCTVSMLTKDFYFTPKTEPMET
ncbi:caspase-7-like [Ptychodera flava]|uniref:caspase-7-like n=1 Tax=Ptychodera flava TaxID=63121 RepID=UPI00396A98DD